MKAIILAAGRGERMGALTQNMPKPLLVAGGKTLIVRHVEKLAAAGFSGIVINHAYLGEQIVAALGTGERYGIAITYSAEAVALETAGGIAYALPLLDGDQVFAAVNADVYSDYPYQRLLSIATQLKDNSAAAHLVLVDNPDHHPDGDFALDAGRVVSEGERLTFSGIGVYRSDMFDGIASGARAPLAPLLRAQIALGRISGEHYRGSWRDIGTPERLSKLDRELTAR